MKVILNLFRCVLLMATFIANSQDYSNNSSSRHLTDVFVEQSVVSSQVTLDPTVQSVNSFAYVTQVGSGNQSLFTGSQTSSSSQVVRVQLGQNNSIDATYRNVFDLNEMIFQRGKNNKIVHFSNELTAKVSLNIVMIGDDLSFEQYGTNELSNKLDVKMTGFGREVIVQNFK